MCEHLLSHIISKRLDSTDDAVHLTVQCDDCGETGETSVDLNEAYQENEYRIYWSDGEESQ